VRRETGGAQTLRHLYFGIYKTGPALLLQSGAAALSTYLNPSCGGFYRHNLVSFSDGPAGRPQQQEVSAGKLPGIA
jgi:hypothetical protein